MGEGWFRNNSLQLTPFSYHYPGLPIPLLWISCGRTSFSGNHIKRNTRDSKSASVLRHPLVFFLILAKQNHSPSSQNNLHRRQNNLHLSKIICRSSEHLMSWWGNAKRIEYGITMAEQNMERQLKDSLAHKNQREVLVAYARKSAEQRLCLLLV